MWAIKGRIVALSDDPSVPVAGSGAFTGRVWIGDDGTVAAVTAGTAAGPAGSEAATVVDVGADLVLPGLIDLHNHLAYNTLPLWTEPSQTTPFLHHDSWPRAHTYAASTTWPAYGLITACPHELLAYVETKAIVGGTTSVQGSPPRNKPPDGMLVRNIEDETFGTHDPNLVYASVLTEKPAALAESAIKMRSGSAFVYHCAEGQRGSVVAREFTDAAAAGCLQPTFVAVHTNAVDPAVYAGWAQPGAIAWSPFSNLWLYGQTTDVLAARAHGITVCLGADWAPSGTKNVQGELKSARLVSDAQDLALSDEDLVRMVTSGPGDVLRRAFGRQLGRIQPGAVADLLVLRASRGTEPYRRIVASTEDDVQLVVVGGVPRYGTPALMTSAPTPTPLTVGGRSMVLSLATPDDPAAAWSWDDVVARMEEVRADPKKEIEDAQDRLADARTHPDQEQPLRLALDMPTGLAPVGGLPHDLADVSIPELESLTHDAAWLESVAGRGFHGGVLDDLRRFYR
jgi:cytosine/adenosine deaminase-related metal-dependent hydrolase